MINENDRLLIPCQKGQLCLLTMDFYFQRFKGTKRSSLFEYFRVGQWAEAAAGGVIYLIILILAVTMAKSVFKIKFSL